MCDVELKKQYNIFTSSEDVDLINSDDSKKLFEELSYRCILPALGTIVEKNVYDEIGNFDDYVYVEDWSFHLRVTRLGIKIHILPEITAYHRDGGISHGNTRLKEEAYVQFRKDLITLCEKEILPFISEMTSDAAKKAEKTYEWRKKQLEQYITSEEHLLKLKIEKNEEINKKENEQSIMGLISKKVLKN